VNVYAIVVYGSPVSEQGFRTLCDSSKKVGNQFDIKKFFAVQPHDVDRLLSENNIKWNYPWLGEQIDFHSGLTKTAYPTADPNKRIACALSHYFLWDLAYRDNQPIVVLEHDAMFINKLPEDFDTGRFDIVGLNDPRGATRLASKFYQQVISQANQPIVAVPKIDVDTVPQGLAGNSAYIVTPRGARNLLDAVNQYGLWPNDALMCRQLIARLGVSTKFYTKVQGLPSTTTQ